MDPYDITVMYKTNWNHDTQIYRLITIVIVFIMVVVNDLWMGRSMIRSMKYI